MHATCPTQLILLDLITITNLVKNTSYATPHYVDFSSLLPLPPS